jgi:hypothetical protein
MSNRTATLYLRVTTKDGKTPFCKPVYLSKGRLKPHYAMVNRQPGHHPEDVYYVRFGRKGRTQKFVSVGGDEGQVAADRGLGWISSSFKSSARCSRETSFPSAIRFLL